MGGTRAKSGHCIVWFGQPDSEERAAFALAGWPLRIADPVQQRGIGTRNGDTVVAVADLRRCDDEAAIEQMVRLVADHAHLPWIALLAGAPLTSTSPLHQLLRDCLAFFTAPVEMRWLIDIVQRLDGGEPTSGPSADVMPILGRSAVMLNTIASVRKYAPVDLPVLITGETGTGKEVAARYLHQLSRRGARPFAAINCGALPANLVQSELFGHERGSFTGATSRRIGYFEAAAGGTVFLDEIGDLPLDAQTNLLRFLQEGTLERIGSTQSIKVDVRVLAATHVDLEKAIAEGRFREDLYYRLNVLRLRMPALREREGDVELLAQHFLDSFREQHETQARAFSRSARQAMRGFAWRGNVRELLNRVQRAAVVAEDALISPQDLELFDAPPAALSTHRISAERDAVIACLRESRFNVTECARRLKVSRVTVYRLCKKHQLQLDQMR
jgi:DNA-binding NtrC family response regulator